MSRERIVLFEVISKLNKKIRVTLYHWELISERKHIELKDREKEVELTLIDPVEVRRSQDDRDVYLYYKKSGKYY